jgi:hypothetical protein
MESLVSTGLAWVKDMLAYDAQVLTRDDIEFLFEFLPARSGGRTEDALTL